MTRPLGIVHLMQWFELGGGESLAQRLALSQKAQGHAVTVLGLAGGPLAEELRAAGVSVSLVEKRPGFDATLYPRLACIFRRTRPDVVHTHDPQSLVYGAPTARICGVNVVHTKHGETVEGPRRLALRRIAARFVNTFVAVSSSTADTARQYREVDETKLRVVTNGVDMERFRPDAEVRAEVRAELGLPADARVIATVGRHEEVKDPLLLLRAALPLLSQHKRLCFVGAGSLTGELERLLALSPAGKYVHLLGKRRDVERLMTAFDIFAISSRTEGLPLVLLEAMATGLPVVATAVGGIPPVVAGGAGLVVPPADEVALRDALAQLLVDGGEQMGRRAREIVAQQFSFRQMEAAYLDLYGGQTAQ